jgi:hypothetical protein
VAPARRWIIVNPGERARAERARLTRRGFWLEYASMAWMAVEAAAAVAALAAKEGLGAWEEN